MALRILLTPKSCLLEAVAVAVPRLTCMVSLNQQILSCSISLLVSLFIYLFSVFLRYCFSQSDVDKTPSTSKSPANNIFSFSITTFRCRRQRHFCNGIFFLHRIQIRWRLCMFSFLWGMYMILDMLRLVYLFPSRLDLKVSVLLLCSAPGLRYVWGTEYSYVLTSWCCNSLMLKQYAGYKEINDKS